MGVRKNNKVRIETYKPKRKIKVSKEEAVPVAIDVGRTFTNLGGMTGFFINSFLMSWKTLRKTKRRIRSIQRRYEKTIDLSRKTKR